MKYEEITTFTTDCKRWRRTMFEWIFRHQDWEAAKDSLVCCLKMEGFEEKVFANVGGRPKLIIS